MARSREANKRGRAGSRAQEREIDNLRFEVGFWRTRAKSIPGEMQRMYERSIAGEERKQARDQRQRMARIRREQRDRDPLARLIKRAIKSFNHQLPRPAYKAVIDRLGELDHEKILHPSNQDYLVARSKGLAVRWRNGMDVILTPASEISSRISRAKRHPKLR